MQHAVVLFILTLVGIVLALPMTGNTVAVALQRDNPVLVRFSRSSLSRQPWLTPNSADKYQPHARLRNEQHHKTW